MLAVRVLVATGVQTGLARLRVGFHHHGGVGGPGDREAEAVGLDAKVGGGGQNAGYGSLQSAVGRSPKVGPQPVVPGR